MSNPPRTPPAAADDPNQVSGGAPASQGTDAPESAPARIIKRYSNRKLYDTVESRYVTLPQIAELVRRGEDVRIIDNNTKEDLTSVTLAQILYEEERKQSRALPLTALKDLIHTSGEKIISTLREGPMGKLMGSKAGEPGAAEQAPAVTPASTPAPADPARDAAARDRDRDKDKDKDKDKDGAGTQARLYEMFEHSRGSLQEWQHRVDDRVRKVLETLTPYSQIDRLQSEVKRLTQRLEEIEARLDGRAPKRDEGDGQ